MNSRHLISALLAAALLLPLGSWAHDDDDEEEEREHSHEGRANRRSTARQSPAWKGYASECGSCHLAFPPSMLPARSWRALLGGLGDHFGQNAEVDEATRKQLETFLVAEAGRDVPGAPPLRITQLRWWVHEHDEVRPAVFQRKAVLSPANCGACHPGANEGAFGEHEVKIPRDAPAPR